MTRAELRHLQSGTPCCLNEPGGICDDCIAHFAGVVEAERRAAARPPLPYDAGLKVLHAAAAAAAPLSTFEQQYKATRQREADAMRARLDAAPRPPRLTTAEETARGEDLKRFAPPDSYAAGLDKLRSHS